MRQKLALGIAGVVGFSAGAITGIITHDAQVKQQGNPVAYTHCVIQTYKLNLAADLCEGLDQLTQAKWDARNRAEHGWEHESSVVTSLLFGRGNRDCWGYLGNRTLVVCYSGEVGIL